MTFQCYLARTSAAIGAIFVTARGVRRFIPDHCLSQGKLSEQGRLLWLIYAGCTVEVAGQRFEVPFENIIVGRLGKIVQTFSTPVLRDQPWISSLMAMVPALANSRLDRR